MLTRRSFTRLLAALPFAGLARKAAAREPKFPEIGTPFPFVGKVAPQPPGVKYTDVRYVVPSRRYEDFVNAGEWAYVCSAGSTLRIVRVEHIRCEKRADGSFRYHAVMVMPRHPAAR